MKPRRSMLFLAATIVLCVTVINSAQSQQASSSTVKLGDKVIVIPDPDGFEEASSQFEKVRRVLAIMQLPHSDTLLLHMPVSDCDRLRTGSDPEFHHYTKVSVLKSRREVTSSNADMAGFVTEWRKNGAVLFDPDGPLMTSMTERLSRKSQRQRRNRSHTMLMILRTSVSSTSGRTSSASWFSFCTQKMSKELSQRRPLWAA